MARDITEPPPPEQPPSAPDRPAPDEPPAPDAAPDAPHSPGRIHRVRRWFTGLSTDRKIAVIGLALGAIPLATPLVTAAYDAAFGDPAIVLSATQNDDTCSSAWRVAPGQEGLRASLPNADAHALTRWERERKITHLGTAESSVSIRGNLGQAVQLRDLSITVLKRGAALPGTTQPTVGCGGDGPPELFYVDLDTLPVNRPVPASYLQTSPHQKAAREEAARYNQKPMRLPVSVSTSSFYDLKLIGRSQAHYVEWRATLTWWDGEETQTTTIDNGGQPFRVTAERR